MVYNVQTGCRPGRSPIAHGRHGYNASMVSARECAPDSAGRGEDFWLTGKQRHTSIKPGLIFKSEKRVPAINSRRENSSDCHPARRRMNSWRKNGVEGKASMLGTNSRSPRRGEYERTQVRTSQSVEARANRDDGDEGKYLDRRQRKATFILSAGWHPFLSQSLRP
jgi:hypothetical protein